MIKKLLLTLLTFFIFFQSLPIFGQEINLTPLDSELPEPTTNTPANSLPPTPRNMTISLGPKATISLNNDQVEFGNLTPTNPILRFIIISLESKNSYQLLSYQDSLLKVKDQQHFIPNTTCDRGTCNEKTADTWSSTLAYGLGIQCSTITPRILCATTTDSNSYFTLPSDLKKYPLALGSGNTSLKVTYKLNTARTQQSGIYENSIHYILIPSL